MRNGSRPGFTILPARVPLHMHMKLYEHPRGVRVELGWCLTQISMAEADTGEQLAIVRNEIHAMYTASTNAVWKCRSSSLSASGCRV